MTAPALVVSSLISLIFFPWPFTILVVLIATAYEPLTALAIGILAEVLYAPTVFAWPSYVLIGLVATLVAFFVRSRLQTGIIR